MQFKKFTGVIILILLVIWGCEQSGEQKSSVNEKVAPQQEKVETPKQQTTPTSTGEVDKFGRKPGDAHYGHNHASDNQAQPKTNAAQKPAAGEVDKFGRKPGDAHYGHGHE